MSEHGKAPNDAGDVAGACEVEAIQNVWQTISGVNPNSFIELRLGFGVVIYLRTDRYHDMVAGWLRRGLAYKLADGVVISAFPKQHAIALAQLKTRGNA